jgi:hypothetical protein
MDVAIEIRRGLERLGALVLDADRERAKAALNAFVRSGGAQGSRFELLGGKVRVTLSSARGKSGIEVIQ